LCVVHLWIGREERVPRTWMQQSASGQSHGRGSLLQGHRPLGIGLA
jgi:hypothetical protein